MRSFLKVYLPTAVVASTVIGIIVYWSFFSSNRHSEPSLQYAHAQLMFSMVVVLAVIFTLLYATHQFRRSLARPNMRLVLDESGAKKKHFTLYKGKALDIPIYAYNSGDRIAATYQIELTIPKDFERYLVLAKEGTRLDGNDTGHLNSFTVSFYNYDVPEYVCFIGKYVLIGLLRLSGVRQPDLHSQNLKVDYRVFGDWGASQAGSLTVHISQVAS